MDAEDDDDMSTDDDDDVSISGKHFCKHNLVTLNEAKYLLLFNVAPIG